MKQITLLLLGLIYLTACKENEYNASPVDPRLPELSAEGENTAGAYVDAYPWLADQPFLAEDPDLKIYTNKDSAFTLVLLTNGYQVVENNLAMKDVGFYLGNISIRNHFFLPSLKDTVIILDGVNNYGMLINNNASTSDTLLYGIGKLFIRDVRQGFTEDKTIFSGTFGFDFKSNGLNHTVYSGRFDYMVSNRNYYRF